LEIVFEDHICEGEKLRLAEIEANARQYFIGFAFIFRSEVKAHLVLNRL
jgi:hypothetical protein